jgi:hypothetical protein
MVVGYAWLRDALKLPIPAVARTASVQPVSRVMKQSDGSLAVPTSVAPAATADALDHALFALKHEGSDLLVLSQALLHVSAERMAAAVRASPSGQFVRKAGWLWEHFHAATLPRHAFTNGGKLSNHRRKQFADVVPAAAFDAIESIVTQQLLTDPLPAIDDPTVT